MVKFSLFNELSLPLSNLQEFETFFIILAELRSKGMDKIRMDRNFTMYPEILSGVTFGQLMGKIDRDKRRKIQSFIKDSISVIESPLIKDDEAELELLLENEYFYNNNSIIGALACCDIWRSIVVSFNSNEAWSNSIIELQKQTILDENIQTLNIPNLSDISHFIDHETFFTEFEEYIQEDITPSNFWSKKDALFENKIIFCKEVKKQLSFLDTNIFDQVLSILRDIENGTKTLSDFRISGESKSVEQDKKLKKLREFYVDDEKVYFEEHIKSLSSGYRIYFFEKNEKIYIGYIGKHLPTKKFD